MSPMHADAMALIQAAKAAGRPRFEELTAAAARDAYDARRALIEPPVEDVAEVRDVTAPGEAGPIRLRLYRGLRTKSGAVLPCFFYLHGGGWVLGDLETHDVLCRKLANVTRACVIAVDYRCAPEHPFPAALNDAALALKFVVSEATRLLIDPAQLAIGGDSAGGNLAAVLALMGRDGAVPKASHQILLYPAVDLTMAGASYERVSEDVPISAATMRYFVESYVPNVADRTDWHASPLFAPSLAGAPPAFILTCAHDVLSDEGREYVRKLIAANVPVTELHLSDQIHGILTMGRVIGSTSPILNFLGGVLRDAWRSAASEPVPIDQAADARE
jgi:acetyl esterase